MTGLVARCHRSSLLLIELIFISLLPFDYLAPSSINQAGSRSPALNDAATYTLAMRSAIKMTPQRLS